MVTGTCRARPTARTAASLARTASVRIAASRSRFQGRAAPPPFFVTLGTGHPKFRSMWSVRSRSMSIVAAFAMTAGLTP